MKRKNLFIGPLLRIIAGFVVTVGAYLTYTQSIYWLLLVLFVSLNLFQSGFTNFCMMEKILLALGFSSELRELSKKDRYLRKVMDSKQKAIIASRAKSEFLAKMSHEIRTPLNGIIGMVELSMETELNDEQKGLLEAVNLEADTLLSLINNILDFSKIEAGKLELEEAPFQLRENIETLSNCAHVKAYQKGLSFISYIDPSVPTHLVGDYNRLRQVITNLLGNSMKFTNKGDISLSITLESETENAVMLRFEVEDTGIGIAKDKQSYIFDSFAQADNLITRRYGGTGLGTAICKQLVDLMKGEIGLESDLGQGSRFWFTADFRKDASVAPVQTFDLVGKNILIVEPLPRASFVYDQYLTHAGANTTLARDANDALDKLVKANAKDCPVQLVISNLELPGKDGLELAKSIQSNKVLHHVPVMLLSEGDSKKKRDLIETTGIRQMITKPVGMVRFLKTSELLIKGERGDLIECDEPSFSASADSEKETESSYSILLAEDYPTNQQVAIRHLSRAGYQVNLAENGLEAVEMVRMNQHDLILMDIQMPRMDGLKATDEIRKIESELARERTPIIAMTAYAIAGFQEQCIKSGMDDYITKPLRRKTLIEMVEKWTKKRESCSSAFQIDDRTRDKDAIIGGDKRPEYFPMNYQQALEEFENDEAFLQEVLEDYLDVTRVQIDKIRTAITNEDSETIKNEAHSIKGGASNLLAMNLSRAAKRLEKIGMSGKIEKGAEALDLIEEERKRLKDYYYTLIA